MFPMHRKIFKLVLLCLNAIFVALICFNLVLHIRERSMFNLFMSDYNISSLDATSYDGIQIIRDTLYHVINDGNKGIGFNHFDLSKRPINGYSLSFIIKHREGQCGEFTRLLYHVLRASGIRSRPVILYGVNSNLHSVLEITNVGTTAFLIDTNNSVPGLNETFIRNQKPIEHYVKELGDYKTAMIVDLGYFQLFSYFNIGKLSYRIAKTTAFIIKPIPDWINWLYANVFMTNVFLLCAIMIMVNMSINIISILWRGRMRAHI